MNHHARTSTSTRIVATVVGALFLFGITACGSDSGTSATTTTTLAGVEQIAISDVWARPADAGGNTAIYLTITGGAEDDELVGVTLGADVAETVEIHETTTVDDDADDDAMHDDDTMHDDAHDDDGMHDDDGPQMRTMRPVDSIEIPAGGTVELAPGGYHVMVMNLQAELAPGDNVPVTLTFAEGGDIEVIAKVREP